MPHTRSSPRSLLDEVSEALPRDIHLHRTPDGFLLVSGPACVSMTLTRDMTAGGARLLLALVEPAIVMIRAQRAKQG